MFEAIMKGLNSDLHTQKDHPHHEGAFRTNAVLDIYVTVECSLKELYTGCIKRKTFIRKTFVNHQSLGMVVEKWVEIPRGTKHHARIVFKGEGEFDDRWSESGDLIFVVEQKVSPNDVLERVGFDQEHLKMVHRISLKDSLTLEEVNIVVDIFGLKKLNVKVDNRNNVISPQYYHVIHNEGMPMEDGTFGDLVISFKIEFPKLSSEQWQQVISILSNDDSVENSEHPAGKSMNSNLFSHNSKKSWSQYLFSKNLSRAQQYFSFKHDRKSSDEK
ncbi:hypothetical protein C9374_001581 [Naegleria lovaniensis]|uniref:Chaperone DnaJ C-terminal domain-containing protein n=1 Tax=Naegleria lovaniensis TaxID=51637 RepID=A0AA88KMT0_NAELO|nr:uncharacterized protein C9374_001581 [Naegleria lovaniensis]KAG2387249.1 hypothetical protein C9374_001581 [Naegleria lovaniensis]